MIQLAVSFYFFKYDKFLWKPQYYPTTDKSAQAFDNFSLHRAVLSV